MSHNVYQFYITCYIANATGNNFKQSSYLITLPIYWYLLEGANKLEKLSIIVINDTIIYILKNFFSSPKANNL